MRRFPRALAAVSCVLAATSAGAAARQAVLPLDLDPIFAAMDPKGPGCAVGVEFGGAAPVTRAYGLADLEHPVPITVDTIFETGSLAKQFTAAAMMLLVQDKKLSLDDDIRRFLPEMPDYGTPISIRHLLTHSSGLREQWSLLALAGSPPGSHVHSQAIILDVASHQKGLNFAPGAEYLYTNTNYALAAIIIERASGQSLQAFTNQRLFQPLGMTHSRWREDFRTVVPGRATAYASDDPDFIANMPFTNVLGNGGLLTTIGDLLAWNAFLNDPSRLPGGQALVTALQTPGKLNDGTLLDYALGLEVTRSHGQRLVAHSGSTAGYKAWLGRYPDKAVSIALLCNNGDLDPVALGDKIAVAALRATGFVTADPAKPPLATKPARIDLTPYVGRFRNPITGDLAETSIIDQQLVLQQGAVQTLTPAGAHFRRADGDDVTFAVMGNRVLAFTLTHGRTRQRFVTVAPAATDAARLAAYAGTYYSPELDTRVTVVQQGNALTMRQRFATEWPLKPSFADAFTTRLRGTTTFVFNRGVDGGIDGFGAWAIGARNIRFIRQPDGKASAAIQTP